jgi:hypothetical protein
MARSKRSLVERSFRQMDLSFWCMHEHLPQLALLALPTVAGVALLSATILLVVRNWELPFLLNYVLYSVVYPTAALMVVTLGPVPCAVFAYHRAAGRVSAPRECLTECWARRRRLAALGVRLVLCYLFWFLLFGIPMFFFWPRTCLSPLVMLFESERKVLVRCHRLLKEEKTIYLLAALYTLLSITLGLLIAVPRVVLLSDIVQTPWTQAVREYLWSFEFLSGTVLLAGMAVSWTLSLTFLYCDIRRIREGEELRERLKELRQKLVATAGS